MDHQALTALCCVFPEIFLVLGLYVGPMNAGSPEQTLPQLLSLPQREGLSEALTLNEGHPCFL